MSSKKARRARILSSAQKRIREAEAGLVHTVRETIRIDETDLDIVADLIGIRNARKTDILRRAVSIGLEVMRKANVRELPPAEPEVLPDIESSGNLVPEESLATIDS
jgi:hypothetical protein